MPVDDDVVIVAARDAWPEYRKYSAYVCQPDRPFRRTVTHMGFYCGGSIQPLIPVIKRWVPSVLFTRSEAHARRAGGEGGVGNLIDRLLLAGPRTEGVSYGVMLLSTPEDPETVRLQAPIANDSKSPAGRTVAWTRWQRYLSLERLMVGASVTSDL